MTRGLWSAAVAATLGLVASASASAAPGSAGAAGVGDPYFPTYGNGGYQVVHYGVDVRYQRNAQRLVGATTIRARSTQRLTSFHLDLMLHATRVEVNGRPARFHKPARHELVVVPSHAIRRHSAMTVTVWYAGRPGRIKVPFHVSGAPAYHPWVRSGDDTFVNGCPEGAALWFPVNDHPVDKAAFDITVRAPRSWQAVANGRLVSHRRTPSGSVWHWRQPTPMVSYLAFLGIGHYAIQQGKVDGRPFTYAWSTRLGPHRADKLRHALRQTPRRVAWLTRQYGRYPFRRIGGVVPPSQLNVSTIESQGGPVYNTATLAYGDNATLLMTHELAHQWFGDSVSVRRYRDLWLNEGLAVWTEWLYAARHGGPSLNEQLRTTYDLHPSDDGFWDHRTGDPGPRDLWLPVYTRGAMTAQALRNVIGAAAFRDLLRTWVREHRHGHATTRQFIRLAEAESGQDLSHFFEVWLDTSARPDDTPENGVPPA